MNVPNLPIDPIVDDKGLLTAVGKNFFEQLIRELIINFSNEGLVAPTQSDTNIATIVANTNGAGQYTAGFGRILYDSTSNSMQVTINNGSGVPILKTFTVT